QFHVARDVIFRVIDAAPDAEWRLLIALSRFGGLRCPSEHLSLRWQAVDWERNRFRVDSPKTGERWIPIFPELRPYLEECFELAEEGAVHVITRYRDSNANLRRRSPKSSSGLANIPGPSYSTTCEHPGKPNWRPHIRSTSFAIGSATRPRSLPSIT